jgi:hypothetical protein
MHVDRIMKINSNAVHFASLDMSMTTDHDDETRSTRKLVSNNHYGPSSGKVPMLSVDRVSCRHRDVNTSLTRSDDGQSLHLDPFLSTTQSRWPVVTEHYATYDSSSDLRAKAFESSTLFATPIPSDLVPQKSALRAFTGDDSRCARKPQNLLHSHSLPSQFFYHHHQSKANMAMMNPSSSTPRSRSIKIARKKRSETDFEADLIDRNKSLYDSATWRMYNRITEYRRQHPINYDDMDVVSTGSGSIQSKSPIFLPRKESSALYGPRALNRVLMSVGPVTSREQHKLDGEVFDMEL